MKKDNTSQKQIGINMLANIVSHSASIIISFFLTPFLINTLGKETYSFYPMANQIVSYLSVLTNAMNSMASRFVTLELVRGNEEKANGYYSSALAANLLMSAVLCVPMIVIIVFMDSFMDIPVNSVAAIKSLFAFVFASALVNVAASIFGIATFAKNRIDLRSLRELATSVIRLGLYLLLYQILTPSIVYVGVVTLIVALINILFQLYYTKRLLPEIRISRRYVRKKYTMEMLSSSAWNAINTFGNTLLTGTSMVLANMFYGADASGSYSIVQTVPQFINGIICMLVGVFYPVITYRYAQKDTAGLVREVNRAQSTVGFFGCATVAVFSALASEFFNLWTPGENARYLSLLSFLTIIPHFIISCMWTLTNVNVVMNKVKISACFTLGCGVSNILIAFIVYKVTNVGVISLPIISTLLQLIWVGVFMPLYVSKNLGVKWTTFYPPIVRALITAAGVMAVILFVKQYLVLDTWLKFVLAGGIFGGCSLVVFAITMFGPQKVGSMLRPIIAKLTHKRVR